MKYYLLTRIHSCSRRFQHRDKLIGSIVGVDTPDRVYPKRFRKAEKVPDEAGEYHEARLRFVAFPDESPPREFKVGKTSHFIAVQLEELAYDEQ